MKRLLLLTLMAISLKINAQQSFTWTQIADYPYQAWGMNACGHNGLLYSFSNCGSGNNTLYSYTPATNKWDTLAKLSGSIICNTSLVGVGNKLYLSNTGSVNIYDIATNAWETNTISTPTAFKKDGAVAVAVGTDIYYIGGSSTKNLYKLNTITKTFTKLADMNTARENVQAAYLNGKIYVFGGRRSGSALNSIEEYDINSDNWTAITSTIDIRYFGYAVADDNYIYLIGGEKGVNNFKYKTIDMFNPTTKAITQLALANDMTREHTAFAMGLAGNNLIAAAGFTSTPSNAITTYSESTNFTNTVSIMQHISESLSFKTYPNPANGMVYVQIANPEDVESISILNLAGQQLNMRSVNARKEITIDVTAMPTGTYLIRANGKNGSQTELLQVTH